MDAVMQTLYFQNPWAGLLLLLLPLYWLWHVRQERRRWKSALAFSYAAVVAQLRREPVGWRRLWMPVLMSGVLACLITAVARPTVTAKVPVESADLMLVMDISLSMMARDIAPTRIEAAKTAGIRFIESLPRDARIGLELFAGNTYVVSPPVREHRKVIAYLQSLRVEDLQTHTEIGSAIQSALMALKTPETTPSKQAKPPRRLILLLSDGDSREGYPWQQAAMNARQQNVVIHTVGIGRLVDTVIDYQGLTLPVAFSETTLRRIAEVAQGEYFRVFRPEDFKTVYNAVKERAITYEERPEDLGYVFAALALVLLLLSQWRPGTPF